jgi:Trk K+ transport system NAD-binding subunit
VERVISRVEDAAEVADFSALDVQAINPTLSPVVELEYLLLYPSVSSLMTDLDDEHDVAEVRLGSAELGGRRLQDLGLPPGVMIVLVRRGRDVIYPKGHTVLRIGDRLTLMGEIRAVREFVESCK